ncbi:NAD(P)/FAD-dependent oxidoreductase [Kribbella endophytica]
MTSGADAVVVGAGVVGSAVALELARQGARVVVVDKEGSAGQGSTSASDAVVRFNYSTVSGVAAAWESLQLWSEWADHVEAPMGSALASFRRTGMVMLDAPSAAQDRSRALFERVGVPFEQWGADTLRARVPGLDPGRFWPPKRIDDDAFWAEPTEQLGALFTPDAGFVDDPVLATRNLADAVVRYGGLFLFRRTVVGVRRAGGRVAGVLLASGERVDAPIVVNCAGPWSGRLNALADVTDDFTIAVRPMRQEVHHLEAPPGYGGGEAFGPIVSDPDLGIYLRPAPGNVVVVGSADPDCDPPGWIADPDFCDPGQTTSALVTQVTRAARRFPELRLHTRPKGVTGVYDVASDWTPIYDRTNLDGYYVAMGTSGNQFKNAPLVGRMMATLIRAVEGGHDHDSFPLVHRCEHTGNLVELAGFSRKRQFNDYSTLTVVG